MRGVARSATALNVAESRAVREHSAMSPEIPPAIMLRLAREQRTKAVQAEAIIWRAVRDRRCEGAKFRRQATIGNFIADFVCYERRLIVEIAILESRDFCGSRQLELYQTVRAWHDDSFRVHGTDFHMN